MDKLLAVVLAVEAHHDAMCSDRATALLFDSNASIGSVNAFIQRFADKVERAVLEAEKAKEKPPAWPGVVDGLLGTGSGANVSLDAGPPRVTRWTESSDGTLGQVEVGGRWFVPAEKP